MLKDIDLYRSKPCEIVINSCHIKQSDPADWVAKAKISQKICDIEHCELSQKSLKEIEILPLLRKLRMTRVKIVIMSV